ncbi:MAG TPA: hypothetical protein VIL36_13090 [Acidimicrobiales bacterium]
MTSDEGEHHVCPAAWLVDEVGRYLAGDDADDPAVGEAGRTAVRVGAQQVHHLLRSAYGPHEVVATELRFTGPRRGARRTVFAEEPTPVALLLLCLRLCDRGDEVAVLHHTAGNGTTTRRAVWPFGMARAEELTRPPGHPDPTLAGLEAALPDAD